jgi:hypothetical protein
LPKSLFALSETFFDKSKARSRRFQNSPPLAAQTVEIAYLPLRQDLLAKKRFNDRSKEFFWATACLSFFHMYQKLSLKNQ